METPELICNCNDEFRNGLCPIHDTDVKMDASIILTDENLIPEKYRRWEGLVFNCTKCGEPSVMDFHKYCGNCGAKVTIRSRTLTDAINELVRKNRPAQ